jgi:hypothetical protein
MIVLQCIIDGKVVYFTYANSIERCLMLGEAIAKGALD